MEGEEKRNEGERKGGGLVAAALREGRERGGCCAVDREEDRWRVVSAAGSGNAGSSGQRGRREREGGCVAALYPHVPAAKCNGGWHDSPCHVSGQWPVDLPRHPKPSRRSVASPH